MPELDYISVHGFKSIAAIEKLGLRPINILIGANGSGKSNFIGVFSLLQALFQEQTLDNYVVRHGGAEKLLHFGSKHTSVIKIHVQFHDKSSCLYKLKPTANDSIHVDKNLYIKPVALQVMNNIQLFHFHDTSSSSPMKKTADVDDNRYLRPDGANLAAYLYFLKMKEENAYQLIRQTIQRVAPFFDDFQLEPLRLNPNTIKLEWKHRGTNAYFDASSLSDGTLRFIALATLFLQPKQYRPSVILVDEPELGLHPAAITLLASLIKLASKETQVIVSTQSSLLLDHFQPEDILVAERIKEATEIRRLKAEELATWLEDYSLGQLWEKNYLGGRPGAA